MRPFFLLILSIMLSHLASGQFYSQGQDPGSLRWKQIKTPHFQVIFPEGYEHNGAYLADVLDYAHRHGGLTLGHAPRRVPVVIHNQTVISNGFVSWAPRRMELFTNPPQDSDGHDWLETLAVHEFRHVVQVDKMHQGITRWLSYLFGEQATGAVFGLFLPVWFIEGDAVAAETGLSYGGRGRLPSFEQGLRAQVLERGIYSFEKASLGSLRDHVPNHYELGYQLVAAAREQYGADIWDKVLDEVAFRPYTLRPFTRGLQKHAGTTKTRHYRQTMSRLDSLWRVQYEQYTYTPFEAVTPQSKTFTNYRYPGFIGDSTLVAYKTSLGDIPRVVAIDSQGQENILFTPGFVNALAFSTNGSKIVYSGLRTDPRWAHRSWSEIYLYDPATREHRRITKRTRYFSPALSPDNQMIAAAEVDDQNNYSIVVIDADSGEVMHRYATEANDFLMTPAWHENKLTLAAIALDASGKRIVVTDKELGGFTTVFHAGRNDISQPKFLSHDQILFSGAFSGVDMLYILDVTTGTVRQVVSSPFGATDFDISCDGNDLVYSAYTSGGYAVHKAPLSLTGPLLEEVEHHGVKFYETLAEQEGVIVTRDSIPRTEYLAIPYYKAGNLFRFHSWGPFVIDADNVDGNPGFSLVSQNTLSTSWASLGYEHDLNEDFGRFFIKYRYEGFYPKLEWTTETGLRQSYYRNSSNELVPFEWRERVSKFGASVPLTTQRGAWFAGVMPSVYTGIRRVMLTGQSPSFLRRNDISSMEYRLFAYMQYRTAARDLRPRWGQIIDLNYRHSPFGKASMGQIFATRFIVYTPGVARQHSLRLSAAYQYREAGARRPQTLNFSFGNLIVYPRGIEGRFYDDEVVALSADYSFPLFYPDWTIPGVLYIKRFSANAFYDYATASFMQNTAGGTLQQRRQELYATGADLMAQVHLFRFVFPLNIGIRVSTHTGADKLQFRVIGNFSIQ